MTSNDEVLALTAEVKRLTQRINEEKEAKRTSNRRMRWFLGAVVMLGVIGFWQNDQRIEDVDREEQHRCEASREGREALRELIFVAIGDLDRDGQPDQPGGAIDPEVILATPQFRALSSEDLAAWELILRGLTADDGPSTSERLVAYSESLPPITCN